MRCIQTSLQETDQKLNQNEGCVQPLKDHVKINVDAAFDADSRRGSTGAVTRDLLELARYVDVARGVLSDDSDNTLTLATSTAVRAS
jgi:hypothetical protein